MSPEKYHRIVLRSALVSLAELEGRLRALTEEKLAAAGRLLADVEGPESGKVTPEQYKEAETAVANWHSAAAAATREADAIRARALAIMSQQKASASQSAPAAPAKAVDHRQVLEDVSATLEAKVPGNFKSEAAYKLVSNALDSCFFSPTSDNINLLVVRLQCTTWPSDSAPYVEACVTELRKLLA